MRNYWLIKSLGEFMTKEELIKLLLNPNQTGQAIEELSCLVEDYPYFHTGHQLYMRGLRQTDEGKMASQLKKTALFVRDRDVLYHYINHPSPQKNIHPIRSDPTPIEEKKQPFSETTLSIVDREENVDDSTDVEIREVYSEQQLVDDLIKVAHKRSDWDKKMPQNEPVREETKEMIKAVDVNRRWTSAELIDFFLKSNHKILPNDSQYEVDLSDSLQDAQEVATETLADIYATQGHKDKAIEIYEQLILKNPKKHIYFAAQIERLKE